MRRQTRTRSIRGTPSLGKPGQCGAVHVEGAPEDKWWGDHTARRLLKWGAALPA